MVDLVKIRKKAKERQEQRVSGVGGRVSGEPASDAAHSDAATEKRRASKKTPAPAKLPNLQTAAAADSNVDAVSATLTSENVPDTRHPTPDTREPTADRRPPTAGPTVKSTKLDRFKEQAGRRREDADSIGRAAVEAIATDQRLEVLTFAIAGENYAIDIEHIVEIVPPRAATRVPNAAESIVGIMSLRGTIVTLIDVGRRLKHAAAEPTAETRIIVIEHEGETVGFEVDRVFRVVRITAGEVEPHPVVHASELDESIRGVFRHGDSLTILLDFAKLLVGRESQRTGPREALTAGR